MRYRVMVAFKTLIPLFAERPSHSFVPLGHRTAGARSEGQGRPTAGACALPLTAASTLAGWWLRGEKPARRYAVLMLAGVLSVGMVPTATLAQSVSAVRPVSADPYGAHIAEASQRFGIPEGWIRAVLRAESAGDMRAVSSAGAIGLMQVMPDTWAGLRARHGLGRDPYQPRDNILAGTAYLREMWDRYGNVAAMLAAYNAGPGRYDDYLATGRTLPAETRAYVAALAPILGGAAVTEAASLAPPPPPDWREATLFVMRSAGTRIVGAPPSEVQSSDGRGAIPAHAPADPEPQDGSIFVARAGGGAAP
ncbi:MAG: lytic transglycosylase domain-containing protein [Alphaproteobacteria bacterium]|nr:lytic transglycosylase domain-containing protein [Alphaproteobacteria bacterium]MBU2229978.1 lytic transglycosylase domain-containing protein [Alphaproteobacteria bacterium]